MRLPPVWDWPILDPKVIQDLACGSTPLPNSLDAADAEIWNP